MHLKTQKACVIGAGPSGLIAIRHLLREGYLVTCFEGRSQRGGTWSKGENDPGQCLLSFDSNGFPIAYTSLERKHLPVIPPTAIYNGLHTNIPVDSMSYRNRPFSDKQGVFPPGSAVGDYLLQESQDINEFIVYNRYVSRIHTNTDTTSKKWTVQTVTAKTFSAASNSENGHTNGHESIGETSFVDEFDYVVIANGHYAEPYIPKIKGLPRFSGKQIHARFYRDPDPFMNLNCIVVGKGPSGSDIMRQIATCIMEKGGKGKLYQSNRSPPPLPEFPPKWHDYVTRVAEIDIFENEDDKSTVALKDGTRLNNIDIIIWATGYYYAFPFAKPNDAPFDRYPLVKQVKEPSFDDDIPNVEIDTKERNRGVRVHNLDSYQIFYLPEPSLAVIGLPFTVIPFPLVDVQCRAMSRFWAGKAGQFKPKPRDDEDQIGEDRLYHFYGYPKEFDIQDQLLHDIGEGGSSAGGNEIDNDGRYLDVAQWRRYRREITPKLRLDTLGY